MDKAIKLSIVIPLYNESENLNELYSLLSDNLESFNNSYEIVFVDDGSADNSFEIIKQLSLKHNYIRAISLSRNFGHQTAIYAGLSNSRGEAVVMMDADLQHPPSVISELYQQYLNGYDIVNTKRIDTKKIGIFKNFTSKIFYRIINTLSDIHIEPSSSDFRLMSRKAVDAFLRIEERDRFTRGLVSWMGFKQTVVNYSAPARYAGKSKYTLKKMTRFALDGITSFSSKPLRISFYAGFIIFIAALIYAIYIIISYFNGKTFTGWASMMLIILLIGGVQLLSIGIIGEYIARVFNESKARPVYFIKDAVNID